MESYTFFIFAAVD